jgi:hypothetical protein
VVDTMRIVGQRPFIDDEAKLAYHNRVAADVAVLGEAHLSNHDQTQTSPVDMESVGSYFSTG